MKGRAAPSAGGLDGERALAVAAWLSDRQLGVVAAAYNAVARAMELVARIVR